MTTVDITPSPRVLRMLGQIDFAPWQCLAELIDNSIDAFIDQTKEGRPPLNPLISITLPRAGEDEIAIKDNGRGMSLDAMKNAVKAGYSGNDPVEKMGLFGMGFNISTARLGRRTEVWTTTVDSAEWIGLVIDFDELERSRTFHAPLETRQKSQAELDQAVHGTEIRISRLEAGRVRPLNWGVGKKRTKDKLGKIYGRIMSMMGIAIIYDGDRIEAMKHCVWDKTRGVETQQFGRVPAVIEIDQELESRRFCTTCWVWLTSADQDCPSCGVSKNVVERKRRLKGWLGIQRYFDKDHYGIDLIRNGRVIQELDKSFFTFTDDAGESIFEYPIDATHWGGRIVGELEIDFVRVSHQKDSFDKLDPEWRHVVEAVRGTSPMQPRIAERLGLPKNDSPLARLFAGYRKGTAGLKDLVPGNEKGAGLNSGVLNDYKDRFYAGDPEYKSDEKWYELVLRAERAKRGGSSGADDAAGDLPIGGSPEKEPDVAKPTPAGGDQARPSAKDAQKEDVVEADQELSRTYEADFLSGSPAIRVSAFRHSKDIEGAAFRVRPESYTFRFDYNSRSEFFEQSLESPLDCLLIDLGQHFLAVSSESPRKWPVSMIARELKRRYFADSLSTLPEVAESAGSLLNELRQFYDERLPACAPIDHCLLSAAEIDRVRTGALRAESASTQDADKIIADGRFARYVSRAYLPDLVQAWPSITCDGDFFVTPYLGISQSDLRDQAVDELVDCLRDVAWLCDEGSATVNKDNIWRLQYAKALASLRLVQEWRA